MKILYVGTERAEAQALAAAIGSQREGVSVSWTSGLDQAAHWIDQNDGLRVLVVEAQPENDAWRAALTYAAGLPDPLPVVVIVSEAIAPDLHASALEKHECVFRNPSLFRELPGAVTRAIDRARKEQLDRAMRDMVHEQFRTAAVEIERVRQELELKVVHLHELKMREVELEGEIRRAEQGHAAALATADTDRAGFERERARAEETRAALTAELRDVTSARDHARHEHESAVAEIARLTERETALEAEVRSICETRDTLQQALARTAAAMHEQQDQHANALATAANERASRQSDFERERAHGEEERAALSTQLREVEAAREHVRRQYESAVADIARLTEREAALAGELNETRAMRDTLEQTLARTVATLEEEQQRHTDDQARATAEIAGLAECKATLEGDLRAAEEAREHARGEHHSAVIGIARLTEREADLEAELAGLTAQLAEVEKSLASTQEALDARGNELEIARRQCEVLQAEVNQLPGLQHELQQSRTENSRMFQQAPVPMFRCTKDGTLTHANRMLTVLVGRSAGELRGADLAALAFESPTDLPWLVERCFSSKAKESIETTWRGKDGSRLLVRLTAFATASDVVECAVEDLTPLRVLQDRLSQAHQMEAVGRLASEVSVTCNSLLAGVRQHLQQWLATYDGHTAGAQRGEMMLEEISRATGLLRQLAAYSDEESRKPAAVELRAVVRDVAPVLKRVAGDAVEVQLPAASAPLNVDAGGERVKRLLVNLAAYGRERMPYGGRLKIELGTTVVDRHFAAKYPNVRLGPHALVTVTESRRSARTEGPLKLQADGAGSGSSSVAVQTGVDLGTLQELVAECGGHLWMTVEPVGDMVVKMRLPLVTSYGEPARRPSALGGRVRTLGQWFQH